MMYNSMWVSFQANAQGHFDFMLFANCSHIMHHNCLGLYPITTGGWENIILYEIIRESSLKPVLPYTTLPLQDQGTDLNVRFLPLQVDYKRVTLQT